MLNEVDLYEDQFFEIDSFEEFDDIELEDLHLSCDMMKTFNNSHKKISALDYCKQSTILQSISNEPTILQSQINSILAILSLKNLEKELPIVYDTLNKFVGFLSKLLDFTELLTSLQLLENILTHSKLNNLNDGAIDFVVNYLVAILKDLESWLFHVFIKKDAVDVFYINASSLNSCIQLEAYIKQSFK
jgi:hypothetical protein